MATLLTPLSKGQIPQSVGATPKRYRRSWAYQDGDGNFFLGTFAPLNLSPDPTDKLYVVEAGDVARPDLIAHRHYRDPRLYWAILWVNGIRNPFEGLLPGMLLRIPTLQRLIQNGVVT